MITKEKIIEILHSYSYNVEDQAGNHLIVVDDDSWDAIATEVKNSSTPNIADQNEHLKAFKQFLQSEYNLPVSNRMLDEFEQKQNS